MNPQTVRQRLAATSVARMATVDATGGPHLVPIVFVADQDKIYTPIDHKPKRTKALKRLSNIAANPRVSILLDHYDEDWSSLWWIRMDGIASIIADGPEWDAAVALLVAKYDHYTRHQLTGNIIRISIKSTATWEADR